MSKSDEWWCVYLVVNCVGLRTFWTPLVCDDDDDDDDAQEEEDNILVDFVRYTAAMMVIVIFFVVLAQKRVSADADLKYDIVTVFLLNGWICLHGVLD